VSAIATVYSLHGGYFFNYNTEIAVKFIIGCLMMVSGLVLGAYAGIWWAFIGGIMGVVNGVTASPVDAMMIAYGIAKVVFAGFIGTTSALVLVVPGAHIAGLRS